MMLTCAECGSPDLQQPPSSGAPDLDAQFAEDWAGRAPALVEFVQRGAASDVQRHDAGD